MTVFGIRLARRCGVGALGLVLALFTATATAQATDNPIVRVSTTFGDFSIELFEQATPASVENFLNYVQRGDYEGTFIHRVEPDFVVQGGGHRFVSCTGGVRPCGPLPIRQDPPVENEPGISNTRGTVAMAKLSDDENSATNQWFVNLGDNSENLDEQNGGFTVFGQVLGDGMTVVDRLANQSTFNLGGYATSIPLRNFGGGQGNFPVDRHFIKINPVQVRRFSTALNTYEYGTGRLGLSVDAGEEIGALSLNMRVIADDPDVIFELNPGSMIPLGIEPEGIATYSEEDGLLVVPQIEVNEHGDVRVLTDVQFRLLNPGAERMRFMLESYQEN